MRERKSRDLPFPGTSLFLSAYKSRRIAIIAKMPIIVNQGGTN
jgi:hypothetical protein